MASVTEALQAAIVDVLYKWLRPYQLRWLQDRARYKAAVQSRQTGKSEELVIEAILQGLEPPESPEKVEMLVSASDAQAKELLRKATRWADLLDDFCMKAAGQSIYARDRKGKRIEPSKECITLLNGVRIVSLPANPRTIAGYTGDIFWDEAGRTASDELMREALFPITDADEGYRIRLTGTPWGDSGVFYETFHGGRDHTPLPGWSCHKVTIEDAVKMGVKRNLAFLRQQFDPITWAQDYMCEFVGQATSVFPRALLQSCMPRPDMPLAPLPADCARAGGYDFGRLHDKSAYSQVAEHPEEWYRMEDFKVLRETPYDEQKAFLRNRLDQGILRVLNMDATPGSIGHPIAEEFEREYPGVAHGVGFTAQSKAQWVGDMLGLMQGGRFMMFPDPDLIGDFAAIRRILLPGGRTRYDAEHTKLGHADGAWSTMLGLQGLTAAPRWNLDFIGPTGSQTIERSGNVSVLDALAARAASGRTAGGTHYEPEPGMPTADDLGALRLTEQDLRDLEALPEGERRAMLAEMMGEQLG